MRLSSVDFPLPERPSTAINSPGWNVTDMSSRALKALADARRYDLDIASKTITEINKQSIAYLLQASKQIIIDEYQMPLRYVPSPGGRLLP